MKYHVRNGCRMVMRCKESLSTKAERTPKYVSIGADSMTPQIAPRSARTQEGQTIIALLVFMMAAITLTLSATMVAVIQTQSQSTYQAGGQALQYAQTGAENALLRLERDTTYSGETLTLANGTATITISGVATKTIVTVGSVGSVKRTITATANITNSVVSLSSWIETP